MGARGIAAAAHRVSRGEQAHRLDEVELAKAFR